MSDRDQLAVAIAQTIKGERTLKLSDSGEGDLIVTRMLGAQSQAIALACHDAAAAAGPEEIEAFAARMKGMADHGVAVSSTGFTKAAREAASGRGIMLMSLYEAEQGDWRRAGSIAERQCQVDAVQPRFSLRPRLDGKQRPERFTAYDSNGQPFTNENYKAAAVGALDRDPNLSKRDGEGQRALLTDRSPGRYVVDPGGTRFEVEEVVLDVTYRVKTVWKPTVR